MVFPSLCIRDHSKSSYFLQKGCEIQDPVSTYTIREGDIDDIACSLASGQYKGILCET